MLVILTEIAEHSRAAKIGSAERRKTYSLREVSVNPAHVVCLREDESMKRVLVEGGLPPDLDTRQRFTRVFLERGQTGIDLVVIGAPEQIRHKIFENAKERRELLRG